MRTRAHGTNGCARDESEGKGRQRRYCGDVVLFEAQLGHFPTIQQPCVSPQSSLVRLAPALSLNRYASTLSSFLALCPPRFHSCPARGTRANPSAIARALCPQKYRCGGESLAQDRAGDEEWQRRTRDVEERQRRHLPATAGRDPRTLSSGFPC